MIAPLALAQFFAGFNLVEQLRNFIDIESNNFLFVQFGEEYSIRRVALNHFFLVEILVEAAQRGEFSLDPGHLIQHAFALLGRSVLQILHVFLQIG